MSSTSGSSATSKTGFLRREDIIGKVIVGQDANIVGTVKDLGVSVSGKATIQVEKKTANVDDSAEVFLSSEEILAVGDFVLLRTPASGAVAATAQPAPASGQTRPSPPPFMGDTRITCPRCNFANVQTARFCVKCGSLLR